ncbi:MAG: PKD domain-containing protein [Bacteroidetes bacterium]|nr:PKD domain-containing protein [Bacteroidota bacterium]
MSKQLLLIFSLVCGTLFATASSVMAQDLRPEDTFFLKPRVGISYYMGDNEKSPFNFNGDGYEAGFPLSIALELGYQFSVPFSVSLAYQYGDYPVITQFQGPPVRTVDEIKDDPTVRHSIQLFGRYTFAKARTKTALFIDFGLAYSFGDVLQNTPPNFTTEESGSAFGPLLGIGLDIAINDKTSFFIESVSGIHLSDTELDANDTNGFGSTDILTGIGFGLKFNFKTFTPVEVYSVNCPSSLTVGEDGAFTATANDDVASQPVEYRWDFGDGNTATGQSASHSYAQAGTYTVTFTATNSGSTDSGTCTVRVIAPAEIVTITSNKTTVSTCDSDPSVSFSANVRGDAPLTYNWDFGDGTTSNQANPSHTYANTGTYTVTLTLSNSAGTDTRTMTITVNDEGCFDCDITQMNSVFFDRNSSVLTPEARRQLEENLEIFRNCPNINGRLEGYASRDERNTQKLSEDRARAVEQFYIDNGIAASRLTAVGMGATGQTTKKGGASQFRRVDTIPVTN